MEDNQLEILRQRAESGDVAAMCEIGRRCYHSGDYEECVKWYRAAAEQGNSWGQVTLAAAYIEGKGVEQNFEEGAKWSHLAAEQGNVYGYINLGCIYEWGENYEEAFRLYNLISENYVAAYRLGILYYNGLGVTQNFEEAERCFRRAAEQGMENAQCGLGVLYEFGRGVEQSDTEAAKWYRKAAEQGFAEAQWRLGHCYYAGVGVDVDYEESAKWLQLAAWQGLAKAQYGLGILYEEGRGVEQSNTEAAKWYRKAAEQGDTLIHLPQSGLPNSIMRPNIVP